MTRTCSQLPQPSTVLNIMSFLINQLKVSVVRVLCMLSIYDVYFVQVNLLIVHLPERMQKHQFHPLGTMSRTSARLWYCPSTPVKYYQVQITCSLKKMLPKHTHIISITISYSIICVSSGWILNAVINVRENNSGQVTIWVVSLSTSYNAAGGWVRSSGYATVLCFIPGQGAGVISCSICATAFKLVENILDVQIWSKTTFA